MKKFSFGDWIKDFAKWIVPQAGLLYAIGSLAGPVFQLLPNTQASDALKADIVGVFSIPSWPAYFVATLAILLLAGATDFARSLGKHRGIWHALSRARIWVWFLASTAVGFLLKPLAVAFAAADQAEKMNPENFLFALYWVALTAYLHWVGFKDREAYSTITYVIKASKQQPNFRHATAGRMRELLGYFPWVGEIKVVAENEIPSITILLPFTLPRGARTRDVSELRRWRLFNKALRREWREQDFVVRKA